MSKKLLTALAAYAGLAVLAWFTLDASIPVGERELPLRAVTLVLLGLFAVRTLLHAHRERVEQERDRSEHLG
jgi:TctA family transporter